MFVPSFRKTTPGGQKNDRQGMLFADFSGQQESISVGQHDIQDREIRRLCLQRFEHTPHPPELDDLVIIQAQVGAYRLPQRFVILDYEYSCHDQVPQLYSTRESRYKFLHTVFTYSPRRIHTALVLLFYRQNNHEEVFE